MIRRHGTEAKETYYEAKETYCGGKRDRLFYEG
jgi:hypothetical protein